MFFLYHKLFQRGGRRILLVSPIVIFLVALVGGAAVYASNPAQDANSAPFETEFMEKMIDHHNMAAEMAKVCLQKATHNELRSMCQNIIDSQTKEIQEMQAWLLSWYQVSKPPQMMPDSAQMMNQLNGASGADFEKMFMQTMIPHHSTAIQEATPCMQRAAHAELKTLCQNIISSQSQEITQMQTWLTQWYKVSTNANVNTGMNTNVPASLPQTGGAFETNLLPLGMGLLLLGAGFVLFRAGRKARG